MRCPDCSTALTLPVNGGDLICGDCGRCVSAEAVEFFGALSEEIGSYRRDAERRRAARGVTLAQRW